MAKKGSKQADAVVRTRKFGTAGLLEQVNQLRGEIVTILEVYLDQAEAVLATLEVRLARQAAGLAAADASTLSRRLAKLQKKLKPSRGRARDLERVETLLEEIEEMLDGGEPAPRVTPPPSTAAARAPRGSRAPRTARKTKRKAARRPRI